MMRPALTCGWGGALDRPQLGWIHPRLLSAMALTEAEGLTAEDNSPWQEVGSRPFAARFDTILYAVDTHQVTIGDVLAESLAAFISQERS